MAPSHCTTLLRVTSPWRESSEARWLASLSRRLVGEPSRGAERVYVERLVIAIVARQAERRVGVEAREGRNMAGARSRLGPRRRGGLSFESKQGQGWKGLETPSEGRDNGSNELTRTPEPRLSLSSPIPCSLSLSLSLAFAFPSFLFLAAPTPRLSYPSSSSRTSTTTVESNPIRHLCRALSAPFSLSLSFSLPLPFLSPSLPYPSSRPARSLFLASGPV